MSWYDSDWKRRASILIDNHVGGGSPVDVEAVIPSDWPSFWDNVLSTGNDIRVTASDGITLLTYDVASWNHTNRTGTIKIDNYAVPATTTAVQAFVYFDNATAADATSTFSTSSPKTGYIEIGAPGSGSEVVVRARPETPGMDTPAVEISKDPAEQIQVWFKVLPALQKRRVQYQGSFYLESIDTVTYDVLDANGASVAAMVDVTSVRMMHPGWVRVLVKQGSDDTNYILQLQVTTTGLRTLRFHAAIKVRTISPPS